MAHASNFKLNSKAPVNNFQLKQCTPRISFIAVLFLVLAVIIVFRLFVLQIIKHSFFEKVGSNQYQILEEITPKRGTIFSSDQNQNLFPIAVSQEEYLLFAVPAEMSLSATSTYEKLQTVLPFNDKQDKQKIIHQLSKRNDPYEPLIHGLTQQQKEEVDKLQIDGLYFRPEINRFYPEAYSFSQITGFLGFVNDERLGQYGLEEYFEKDLNGQLGRLQSEKDPAGRLIGVGDFEIDPAIDGADIYLTIDRTLQFKVCEIIKNAVEKYGATAGTAIVQNPQNGAILAMCSTPTFDANNYSQVATIDVYKNPAITQVYEPGSIFKAITMAAALEVQAVESTTTFNDQGFLKFGSDTITNAENKKYGEVTMTQVLENSINTGAVFAAQATGRSEFKKIVEDFGFGVKSGIQLPGELNGNIDSLNKKSDIYLATASFGQGISVTPLQMITSFSAIANGGLLFKPYLVDRVVFANGDQLHNQPNLVRRVISAKTANILKAMLVSVVKNGQATPGKIDGYNVGGKTGTAQIAASSGGYLNAYNHSFVGFAPVSSPRFVVFVKINRPTRGLYSVTTAAPTFAEIMKFLLNYYQVPTEY